MPIGDGINGRLDMSGMLGWEAPYCDPFRKILTHPKLIPYLLQLCGKGNRMDHMPLLIAQNKVRGWVSS